MSEVERTLEEARRRHRSRRRSGTVVAAATGALAVLAALAFLVVGPLSRTEIVIAPEEAEAAVEVVEGHGRVWFSTLWAVGGPLTLRVAADGFETQDVEVPLAALRRERLDVVLQERPATLAARADPGHPQTRWFLDGAPVGVGAALRVALAPGDHVLSARDPYHEPASRNLTAAPGQELEVVLTLKPVSALLEITSEPSGAAAALDGREVGVTPLSLEVPGGTRELRLSRAGYRDRVATIEVTPDTPRIVRHYALARAGAQVSFRLSPPGGRLSVDGRTVAAGRAVTVTAGVPHHASYARAGYRPARTGFTLAPGARREIAFALAPIKGVVEFDATPPSEVEIGGARRGKTPLRLELLAVRHEVRFSAPGYRAVTRAVLPAEGDPQKVTVKLRPEAEVRLEEAPERYTNSVGIVMKLFREPGSVMLGSPRGEPGRRANEFRYRVELRDAFYAGVHEVTSAQYDGFLRRRAAAGSGKAKAAPGGDRRPVTGVSWTDAVRFCNWLSRKEGLQEVYRFGDGGKVSADAGADGYRLPSEAEWEWLARKAGRGTQVRFPWGDDTVIPEKSGNLADESAKAGVPVYIPGYDDGFPDVAEVGKFPTNAAGLHDLAGNVREWTQDPWTSLPPRPGQVGPRTGALPGATAKRIVKGSSWRSGDLTELRAAWRAGKSGPESDLGFRVVRYVGGGQAR